MEFFDIENYASAEERERLKELGFAYFCSDGAYTVFDVKNEDSQVLSGVMRPVMLKGEPACDVKKLASENPDIKFIVGGFFSGGIMVRDMAEILNTFENVYLNLSGGIWGGNYMLHELIKKVPVERVLFATAYPYGNSAYKKAATEWELRDEADHIKEMIFCKNAMDLFGGYYGNN